MKYKLTDLVDIENNRKILDSFTGAVGIAAAIIDLEGEVIIGSRWQIICTDFHRVNERTCEKCIESDTQLANDLQQGKRFSIYRCQNGLTDAASPIIIEGEHIANSFVGQFFLNKPDQEFFRRQAVKYGFEVDSYLDALSEVPIVKEKKLLAILDFLTSFTEMVAKMGLDKIQQLQAQELLRDSEKRFRNLAEMLPEAVFETDRNLGLTYANQRAIEMFGYSYEDLPREMTGLDFIAPEDYDRARANIAKRLKGEDSGTTEYLALRKDGSSFPILFHAIPILREGELLGLRGIIVDITNHKQVEEKLAHQSQFHKLLMQISFEYINLPLIEIGKTINRSLKELGRFVAADRVYVFEYDWRNDICKNTYEWCEDGITPQIENLQKVPLKSIPQWTEYHKKGKTMNIPDVLALPEEDPVRQILEPQEIKSLIAIPMMSSQECIGFVGFDSVRAYHTYYEEDDLLSLFGQILVSLAERKHAEEARFEALARFSGFAEASQYGMGMADLDGHIVYVNSTLTRMLGEKSPEDCLGKHFPTVYYPSLMTRKLQEEVMPALMRDGHWHGELELLTTDGRCVPTGENYFVIRDQNGKPCYLAHILTDITERKLAAEALRESERRYRQLYDEAPVGYHELDKKGRIKRVNRTELSLLGYTAEEMLGKPVWEFVSGNKEIRKAVLSKLAGSTPPGRSFERSYIRKDGGTIPVIIEDRVIRDDNNEITGIHSTIQDISAKKELEFQLQQAQKMESIGTLAGGIAHDFNNILSPIMIHSELAMIDLPPDSPVQESLKQIFRAGERARDLVKQILTFARKHEGGRIPINMSRILKESVKLLRSSIPTTIDIQYNILSGQNTVFADPTQLNQIIINLCNNAAHAMEDRSGLLEVALENESLNPESLKQFPDLEPGSYVKLTVKDTGQGIEPHIVDKIFEPYFTTKETGKGTGMGLALVHGIVQNYGGAISVQSKVGKGTSFHVYLPLVEENVDVPETVRDSVQLPKGKERILLVDDEKAAVDVIQSMLVRLGYEVTGRTSSIEALEAFRNHPQRFDLVITDMTMPNMTGKELAEELMSIREDIPIILCTGFSEKIDEKKAGEMGIKAFVMKPIDMRQIANTIRGVLD